MEQGETSTLLDEDKPKISTSEHEEEEGKTKLGDVADLRHFLDELEINILDNTDKLFFRELTFSSTDESHPTLDVDGYQIDSSFDILDSNRQNIFKLVKCQPVGKILKFILINNAGKGVISLEKTGLCLPESYYFSGGGLLPFTQSVNSICGYSLSDPFKKLLLIRTSWIPFLPFLLYIPRISVTMKLTSLDGSPSGNIVYRNWNDLTSGSTQESPTTPPLGKAICLEFTRGLDRKAKYMVFAATLLPLSTYFSKNGRRRSSIFLILTYFLVVLGIGVIVGAICLV